MATSLGRMNKPVAVKPVIKKTTKKKEKAEVKVEE
jgi:hypothetical protein